MSIATAMPTQRDNNATEAAVSVITEPVTSYCGCCIGFRTIWCPDCCGYDGCATCHQTRRVPCPVCSGGGTLHAIQW